MKVTERGGEGGMKASWWLLSQVQVFRRRKEGCILDDFRLVLLSSRLVLSRSMLIGFVLFSVVLLGSNSLHAKEHASIRLAAKRGSHPLLNHPPIQSPARHTDD